MSASARLRSELRNLGLATAFFGAWIALFVVIKTLLLEEYRIDFVGWSRILVGALILSKVVLILEHVPLGAWVRSRPAWVDTLLRTGLYAAGVLVVLVLEHGLRERKEAGGFVAAVQQGFDQTSGAHVLANAICLTGSLLVYNGLTVVRRNLGAGGLLRLFALPLPEAHAA